MRRSLLLLIAAVGPAAWSPLAIGQTPGGQPVTERAGEQSTANVRVEFQGGMLDGFVAAIRGGSKERVNIVLQGGAERIPVAPMSLVDVSVEAALRAALEPRIGNSEVGPDGAVSQIQLATIQTGPTMQPVYVVSVRTQPAHGRSPGMTTEVLSIQRLVMGIERDGVPPVPERVILEAIDAGLALSARAGSARPEINYHKDSGLLLVHAFPADVRLVQEVVKRLTDDYIVRASEAVQARRHKIERAAEMAKFEVRMNLARQRVSLAEARVGQFRQLVDKGQVPVQELSQAELAFAEARAEYDLARIDFNRMREEAELGNTVPVPVDPEPVTPAKPKGR